jgi:hypothetical protein
VGVLEGVLLGVSVGVAVVGVSVVVGVDTAVGELEGDGVPVSVAYGVGEPVGA